MNLQSIFFVLSLLAFNASSEDEELKEQAPVATPEVLPEPLEYRGPRPPSYNSRNGFEASSGNHKSVFRRPTSSIAQEFLDLGYGNSKHEGLNSKSALISNKEYGESSSSSNYDTYTSEAGYGHSCSSGYVNASAVALLAFLFLLNLVQDIIEEITMENMGKRKKRSEEDEESEAMQFLRDGGWDAMKEGLPNIVIPLMVKLSSAEETECITRPLCDANAEMAAKYGEIGKVFGALMSNIASHAYTNRDGRYFDLAQKAAHHGRNHGACHIYKSCVRRGPG